MEKTEMMKRYEEKTCKQAIYWTAFGPEISQEYLERLEAKAAAYDRLMSGGKKTPKEVANFFGLAIAEDKEGVWHAFGNTPVIDELRGTWSSFLDYEREIPQCNFKYTGSWQASLTLPDGWREK